MLPAGRMGKLPVRLKEVVYTVSPFEVSVLSGLWKDLPAKISKKVKEVLLPGVLSKQAQRASAVVVCSVVWKVLCLFKQSQLPATVLCAQSNRPE